MSHIFKGLYVIIDLKVVHGDISRVTEDVIAGGANLIQLRAKEVSTREFLRAGTEIGKICRKSGISFIINDRVDAALALGSDGVHLGQDDMPVSMARKLIGKKKLIGLSVHSIEEAAEILPLHFAQGQNDTGFSKLFHAERNKMRGEPEVPDYIGIGPIFFTKTKTNAGTPVGTAFIKAMKSKINVPLVAIGGINAENVGEVVEAGADAAAVCSAILCTDNIRSATEKLVSAINDAPTVGA